MPYMDTIACAILFEVAISLAAPDIKMEKKTKKKELKKLQLKLRSENLAYNAVTGLAPDGRVINKGDEKWMETTVLK